MEKTNKTSIDKLDEQIKKLSSNNKKNVQTGKVNKKDLVRKVKMKEIDEKIEKNRKKKNNNNNKNKNTYSNTKKYNKTTTNKKTTNSNTKKYKNSNTKKYNRVDTKKINKEEIELENKIRDLYEDTVIMDTVTNNVSSEKVDDTVEMPAVFDKAINKIDDKLSKVNFFDDDIYTKLLIFLFFIFMFLVIFYIILFMALSFA